MIARLMLVLLLREPARHIFALVKTRESLGLAIVDLLRGARSL